MSGLCDLHTHSIFSDGLDSPTKIVLKAKELGLKAVALTDHNIISGLEEFQKASIDNGVEGILGVEFSANYYSTEVHILALFIKEKYFNDINSILSQFDKLKDESNALLIDNLSKIGFKLDYQEIKKSSLSGKVNRMQIAKAMLNKNYVKSTDEAFNDYLKKKRGLYIEPKRIDAFELISFIKSIGAISILAHPFINLTLDEIIDFIKKGKDVGLNGIETEHSTYTNEQIEIAKSFANTFGLIKSGGSDYHGANKKDVLLGVGKGNLKIPYEYVEIMKRQLNIQKVI